MKNTLRLGLSSIFFLGNLCAYQLQEASTTPVKSSRLLNINALEKILTDTPWHDGHGAKKGAGQLGGGLFYYTVAHMAKAKLCVCLGSGGGFVPKLMRQAQRDLQLENAKTILVDGDMGDFGRPKWMDETSTFRTDYPDIDIIIDTTANVAKEKLGKWKIDYFHIDADHSLEGVTKDFDDYLPLMKPHGIITLHDTGILFGKLGCRLIVPILRERGFNVVNFIDIGAGFSLIQLGDIDYE